MTGNISIFFAFLGGLLSFFSPCFFPLLPSFISYIAGLSFSEKYLNWHPSVTRRKLIWHTLLFCFGFALVFLILGATMGILGQFFALNRLIFQKIGGIIIILLGIYLLGIWKIPFLQYEYRFHLPKIFDKLSYLRSFFIGIFFAFGWVPCYGPIIGTIMTLASTRGSFLPGFILFVFYTLGFLLPLLLIAFFFSWIKNYLKELKKITRYFSVFSGILVIIVGGLLFTNKLSILEELVRNLNFLNY